MADFVNELIKTLKPRADNKNRTYLAMVSHIDKEGTVWVYVAGSDQETPTASAASEVKKGDSVNVEWRNNKLYIAGNYSNPAAGIARVVGAENAAAAANGLAQEASVSAAIANDAANRAVADAETAHTAANEANESADSAKESADRSLVQLSIVEDVAGTLNWISEHGTYIQTTDTTVVEGRVYFVLEGGDYVPITNPDPSANPSTSGWYILDVTDSQAEYVMAHLAVTSAGLWVLPAGQYAAHPILDSDGNYLVDSDNNYIADWSKDPQNAGGYKVLLSATGMTVFDETGAAVASYGAYTQIGKDNESRVIITSDSTEFYDDYNGLVGEITQGQSGAMWQYEALSEQNVDMLINRTLSYTLLNDPIEHTDMDVVVCVLPITEASVAGSPPVYTFLVNTDEDNTATYTNGDSSITCAYNASQKQITLTTTGNGSSQTITQQEGTKDDVWDTVEESANIPLPLTGHIIQLTSNPTTGTTISGSYFAGQWNTFSFTAGTSGTDGNVGSSYPYQCYAQYDATAKTIKIVPNSTDAATVLDYYKIDYTSSTMLLYADSTYVKYRIAVGTPSYTFGKRTVGSYKGNYSFVSGYDNSAEEELSTAFGRNTHAKQENQMVIGRNNKDFNSADDPDMAFLIGNGTYQPSNGFGVTWGGTPYMQLNTDGAYGDNIDYYSDSEMTKLIEKIWTVDHLKSDGTILDGMLNFKKILSKILQEHVSETKSIASYISVAVGTLSSAILTRYGNVVTLRLVIYNTSAINGGSNIFEGTITNKIYRPKDYANGVGYFGNHVLPMQISSAGKITVRHVGSAALTTSSSSAAWVSATYIVS